MDASIGSHHTDAELAGYGRLFTHAGVVATAANGRDTGPSAFLPRVHVHKWEPGAARDLTEPGYSVLASVCALVAERRRRGRPCSQNSTATDHLRDYELECQHRPGLCPVQ